MNALSAKLQKLLQGRDGSLILVLDGIDKQRGLQAHTLPALARMNDIVCAIPCKLSRHALTRDHVDPKSLSHPHRDYTADSLPPKARPSLSSLSSVFSIRSYLRCHQLTA